MLLLTKVRTIKMKAATFRSTYTHMSDGGTGEMSGAFWQSSSKQISKASSFVHVSAWRSSTHDLASENAIAA